jgi:phospholipase/carboxylesterase
VSNTVSDRHPHERAHRFDPGEGSDRTTVLLLHGTGGDEHDLVTIASQLAPGAALLSPRGTVDESGQPRFFCRHAEGVFDLDDLVARAEGLTAWTRAACAAYARPLDGLVAVGFANGANMAWATAVRAPRLLRGAVLLAPMLAFEPTDTPLTDGRPGPDLSSVAVLIAAGRADGTAPPAAAERLAAWLTDRGAATQLCWHPGGHHPDPTALVEAGAWMTRLRAAIGSDDRAVP